MDRAQDRCPRTVLIGTPTDCADLARALGTLPSPPAIDGLVTLDGTRPPEAGAQGTNDAAELPLLGSVHTVGLICRQRNIKRAIVCLPARHKGWHAEISRQLRAESVAERVIAPLTEQLEPTQADTNEGTQSFAPAQQINLAELVGRTPHTIDEPLIDSIIRGRTALVTGAGGSIGSELVRKIAAFNPERIVLMERSENALFEIDRHLGETMPGVARTAVLHDVVDAERTLAHLERFKPDIVFHAAAHKHVPLMEDHPGHAITNNLFGTKSIADAAAQTGTDRFVLISTDKAVNPKSVMGATKRMAEWYVQSLATRTSTRMSMVRFGNVLGSAGSVLPIWADQIARGGPLTVTDARMTRFFMTIPEAATLVLQAGAMSGQDGRTGEVFVLDMGEPLGILSLARRFVRASGFDPVVIDRIGDQLIDATTGARSTTPGVIPIVLSGIRPGEKLHEQLSYDAEELCATAHPGVSRLDSEIAPDAARVDAMVSEMDRARGNRSRGAVLDAMGQHVPGLVAASVAGSVSGPTVAA